MNGIAKRLQKLRLDAGLTTEEMAKILSVAPEEITRYESGQCLPDIITLIAYAEHFHLSLDDLCGRTVLSDKLYLNRPPISADREQMMQFIEMCFDPASPVCGRLKAALVQGMEEGKF